MNISTFFVGEYISAQIQCLNYHYKLLHVSITLKYSKYKFILFVCIYLAIHFMSIVDFIRRYHAYKYFGILN